MTVTLLSASVGLWALAVRVLEIPSYVLPSPGAVARQLVEQWPLLYENAKVTFTELIAGFGLGVTLGTLLALLIASSPIVASTLYPLLIAQQSIPMIVLAPLFIIWFGVGILPQILIVALICFYPVAINTARGLLGADKTAINLMHSYGASRRLVYTKILVPGALPHFFLGVRLASTLSVIGTVVGEWTGAQAGLGRLVMLSSNQLRTDLVFAAIVVLIGAGVLMFMLTGLVERLVVPWSPLYDK